MARGRLVVLLCWRAAHWTVGVPKKIASVLIHVYLLGDVRALDRTQLQTDVTTLHGRAAHVTYKFRARWDRQGARDAYEVTAVMGHRL